MLPRIAVPIEILTQPSNGRELKFRPYLVREEKVLMRAKESKQVRDIFISITEVLKACCQERDVDIDKLIDEMPIFDLEILFLKLRSISVNNQEKISIKDAEEVEDHPGHPAVINFDEIKLTWPDKKVDKVIKISKDISIEMKYPSAAIYDDSNEEILKKLQDGDVYDLIVACIDKFFSKNELLKFTKEEIKDFLLELPIPAKNQIKEFILNLPKVYYRIDYTNSLNHGRYIEFKSIVDFFFFL